MSLVVKVDDGPDLGILLKTGATNINVEPVVTKVRRPAIQIAVTALIIVVSGLMSSLVRAGAFGLLPPSDPGANAGIPQSLLDAQMTDCRTQPLDVSAGCTQAFLDEIDHAASAEGLAPMVLPSNWGSLTVPEQIFVVINLERIDRGLQPLLGLTVAWNLVAQIGADDNTDPGAGSGYLLVAGEWAGGVYNALEADLDWMYEDGPGTINVRCPSAGASGCWEHRNEILSMGSCTTCVAGAGYASLSGASSMTAAIVEPNGSTPALSFSWVANVAPYLPGSSPPTSSVSPPPVRSQPAGIVPPATGGYREVGSDGGIFALSTPFYGSMGAQHLDAPIVGMALDPWTGGYWEVASDGGIFAFHAPYFGSMGGRHLDAPIVGMAVDAATGGYWEVASDGGIFAFHAPFYGAMGGRPLDAPVVAISAAPSGSGYREVASDGGIFDFGAPFYGSMGGQRLEAPIVGMAVDAATGGYWEVAADGGVFAFDAPFEGSMGGQSLNRPVVGIAVDAATGGYWEVASDGGVFAFNAPFDGSEGGQPLHARIVGVAP